MHLRSAARAENAVSASPAQAAPAPYQPQRRGRGRPKKIQPSLEASARIKKSPAKNRGGGRPKKVQPQPEANARVRKAPAKKRGRPRKVAAPVVEVVIAEEEIFACECYPHKHSNELSCQSSNDLKNHIDVTTRAMMFSEMITIEVGTKPINTFKVHLDVLHLHCSNVRNVYVDTINQQSERVPITTLSFPDKKPRDFAQLVAWMYHGTFHDHDHTSFEGFQTACRGWALGNQLEIPRYQNYCLDQLRAYAQSKSPHHFLSVFHIAEAYNRKVSDASSPFRRFFAHCFHHLNSTERVLGIGNDDAQWAEAVRRFPDFVRDVEKFQNNPFAWNASKPWDDQRRGKYFLEEGEGLLQVLKEVIGLRSPDVVKFWNGELPEVKADWGGNWAMDGLMMVEDADWRSDDYY